MKDERGGLTDLVSGLRWGGSYIDATGQEFHVLRPPRPRMSPPGRRRWSRAERKAQRRARAVRDLAALLARLVPR